ncbi:hypothetical protein MMC27_002041 [Xylographa pallens]|nr:hypothetical protein [Xylographa pallens]
MQRQPKTLQDAFQLLQTAELVSATAKTIIEEWSKESAGTEELFSVLPSRQLYEAQRILLAATGKLTELVAEPSSHLLEVSSSYYEARALHIAAEKRIADIIAGAGGAGLSVKDIGHAVGIEHLKLSRVMRCLCSLHIFKEVSPDVYANNIVSTALIKNEPLRAYIIMFALDLYSASDHLPKTLSDSTTGPSYDVSQTAFQDSVGTTKPRWEWLEEKVSIKEINSKHIGYPGVPTLVKDDDSTEIKRPELGVFGLAMLGGGRVFGTAHIYDYPWESLGEATIVDVGGGVGGFDLQLSKLYPKLKFVVQDRGPVLEQAEKEVWPKENPQALEAKRVSFMQHDFFNPNPVQNADVYWLRYILHDWSDEYCIRILSAIRASMGPNSRIIVCDQVMNTTLGSPELKRAPEPLPANYGYYARYSHQRDLTMMAIINGIERTPDQFKSLVERAGLRLHKIWECRSQVSLVEILL